MKKLTVIASSLILAGMSATAVAASPEFFIGGQLGYQDNDLEAKFSEPGYGLSNDFSLSGVAGGLFTGVKFDVGNGMFIAPELNVGTSDADGTLEVTDGADRTRVKAEASTSYGAGVLVGADVTPSTSFYGRLGYQRTKYKLKGSVTGYGSSSDSEKFDGFRYGVGVENKLTPDVALRLDWSQTRYSSESYSYQSGEKMKFEPTESLFQVGVSYRF
ncbi:MAG TPA: porin family protein [Halomonas sp.]|nr:porin family protein [Halomonas sp.]